MWSYNYGYLCHGMNDYLEHHGILGQKWGIRRFQNPDGSLTPAGKKRYGATSNSTDSIKTTKGQARLISDLSKGITNFQNDQQKYSNKYFKTGKEKYKQKAMDADAERVTTAHQYFKYKDSLTRNKDIENKVTYPKEVEEAKAALDKKFTNEVDRAEAITKICIRTPESYPTTKYHSKEDNENLKKAADIGIKAFDKMYNTGTDWNDWSNDPEYRESSREWFICEDQTIGYPIIADLVVNKGYNTSQINKLCTQVSKAYYDDKLYDKPNLSEHAKDILFNLTFDTPESYSKFSKECEDIMKKEK